MGYRRTGQKGGWGTAGLCIPPRPRGYAHVADIFQEVDEEVRRERLQKLWESYGHYAIAAAVVVVLAVAAWRGYEWWQARQAAQSGAAFESARILADQGKHAEAEAAFAKLAGEGTASYRTLARMRAAAELAPTDKAAAVKDYDALAADGSIGPVMQDLAAVRAGLILVDTASYDELRGRLEPLTAADRTFRHTARELLAFSAWRNGNQTEARRWIDMIMGDLETPAGIRNRTEVLQALLPATGKG